MSLTKSLIAAALAAASLSAVAAVDYYVVVPLPGKAAGASAITVTLNAATLPPGQLTQAYNYDLKPLLAVTGDAAFNPTNVGWSITSGALPAGITLTNGVLSGTPTVKNAAGSNFQVLASYMTKSGQQAYTIIVNGVALQALQVSAGVHHTCAVTTTGGVKCWGYEEDGELGDGSLISTQPTPVDVVGLTSGVASVSAGAYHTCAVTTTGGVKCWGANYNNQLGSDTGLSSRPTPVDVIGLTSGVASVAAGAYHSCAVTTAGGLKCWGYNWNGELGNDASWSAQFTPVDVIGLTSGVASVAVGGRGTCAVTTAGGLKCWGENLQGELGDGTSGTTRRTPVDVIGLTSGVVSVAVGANHTCAVTTAGGVKCWGANWDGQLGDGRGGDGTVIANQLTPIDVSGLTSGVASVSAILDHTCVVTMAGGVKCWGANYDGQLGDGTSGTNRITPVAVIGLTSGVVSVSAGFYHTCVVTTAGGGKCWGWDDYGQLGDDTVLSSQLTPVDVAP